MTTYYSNCQIQHTYNFPLMHTEWSAIDTCIYTQQVVHVPVVVPPQILTLVCPYTGALITVDPAMPILPTVGADIPAICNNIHYTEVNEVTESTDPPTEEVNDQFQYHTDVLEEISEVESNANDVDPVEAYLRLPKELFPTPKMLSIDPNPIIDEFCMLENLEGHVPWILDLEYGVPRFATTRAIATYDVKFNSIHCKNTPTAIHPGFEMCNSDFKRVILFYYDCIVSNWYNGYIALKNDTSVENFQSWLSVPMQIYGMCWP